jgi:hypothetical protein
MARKRRLQARRSEKDAEQNSIQRALVEHSSLRLQVFGGYTVEKRFF